MNLLLRFFALLAVIFIAGCTKQETEHVPGNTAPPNYTISNTIIENYVNKVYITVLGREPDAAEYSFSYNLLRDSNVSEASRFRFLDSVFADTGYLTNIYTKANVDLLNNMDTADITTQIYLYNLFLTDTQYQFAWTELQNEIDRMELLKHAPSELVAGSINVVELHKRMVNNYFYDQLNMGALNYVVSVFQHFLQRTPTTFESDQSVAMVNGTSGTLFLQSGLSKNDFINIFFSSSDYYEGQVRNVYNRYLFREPTSVEMTTGTETYQTSGSYSQLQKNILATNEYIGI